VARARRILIVEDEPKTAASVEMYLRHGGFRTEVARSGHEGLARAREGKPDLIVLDVMVVVTIAVSGLIINVRIPAK
jgi:DNA-binding response OmpR family regulator